MLKPRSLFWIKLTAAVASSLVVAWVAVGLYAGAVLGRAIEPLVGHVLARFEQAAPDVAESLAGAHDADVRVVRDLSGAITLSGRGVPLGPRRVNTLDEFRRAVSHLPTPGTAVVELHFDGAESLIPPPEVGKRREELERILAEHGLTYPGSPTDS